jgi:hypothetical protein
MTCHKLPRGRKQFHFCPTNLVAELIYFKTKQKKQQQQQQQQQQ